MNRMLTLALAAALILGGGYAWYQNRDVAPGSTLISPANAQDSAAEVDTSMIQEMFLGNPDASVVVTEYASFTCPHCKNFHAAVWPELKKNYIDTGKIKFVYREVYFDRFGLWAGMVARCGNAGVQKYFGMADMMYSGQKEWIADGQPTTIAENLKKIGRQAGLTDTQLDACLSDGDTAKAMVALYQKNAAADDINSTPSFVVNGTKYPNMSYADFAKLLDEKLAE